MEKTCAYKVTDEQIRLIESVVKRGDRAEIVPMKDGKLKVIHVKRQEAKLKP